MRKRARASGAKRWRVARARASDALERANATVDRKIAIANARGLSKARSSAGDGESAGGVAAAEVEGERANATDETTKAKGASGEVNEKASAKAKKNAFGEFLGSISLPFVKGHKKWEKLYAEADGASSDALKQDALMRELLAYDKNEDVMKRFETRKYASGPVSVLAYVTALVRTNRLEYFAVGGDAGIGKPPPKDDGANRLPKLLSDLSERSKGANEVVPLEIGSSAQAPLHINVVGGVGAPRVSLIRRVFNAMLYFFLFVSGLMYVSSFVMRHVAVRVIQDGSSSSSMNQGMPGANGMDPTSPANALGPPNGGRDPSFDPKQYNKENMPEKSTKTFDDVKGCDEAKDELREIVEYLRNPERFTRLGGKLPKGVLLSGPPGTGKTLLARAIAGEADVPFFYRSGSEFEEMFVGVGSKRVRQLFAAAKKQTPCIIFIDEIDSIGTSRKSIESNHRKTLNQLLTEMDGFEQNEGVIVLAATNIAEALDPALTRPGRFDRVVHVPNPDIGGRREILDFYLSDKPKTADVDVDKLARGTAGFSGAELYNLVNIAAVQAAMADAPSITAADLDWARDRVLMGAERKSAVLSEENRKLTAYHEAGHALVALKSDAALPIHKATIMPRGSALGMVMQLPDKDETSVNRKQLMARLDVCMGGRLAEEIIFGPDEVTTGASGDLQQATRLAFYMISDVGMNSNLGPVHLSSIRGASASRGASGSTESAVDAEVIKLLKDSQTRVQKLLKANLGDLHTIAKALMERETLTGNEIRELIGMPPAKEPTPIPSRPKPKLTPRPKEQEKVKEPAPEDQDEEPTIIIIQLNDEDDSPKHD